MPLFLTNERNETVMEALIEALDLVDLGVVLLGPDLSVRFVNQRLIEMWRLPETLLRDHPTYRTLMEFVAQQCWYDVPVAALPAYLDEREATLRSGANAASEIDLTDGRRLAFRCIVTAEGGRMLTYVDVTHTRHEQELQRQARDAAERLGVELRFSNESLESQAVYLASLAEAADAAANNADLAKRRLEQEMADRLTLEAELRRLATTDALTGAMNRAQLISLGQRELERVRRLDQDLAIVMIDIDHFKAVNDRYGHAAGDTALKQVVERLRGVVRQIDLLGRVGGEEFAIILPAITQQAALLVCERLRTVIAATPVQHEDVRLELTVSVGLAMVLGSPRNLDQMLARADAALYAAKRAGRNCVRSADPLPPVAVPPLHGADQVVSA